MARAVLSKTICKFLASWKIILTALVLGAILAFGFIYLPQDGLRQIAAAVIGIGIFVIGAYAAFTGNFPPIIKILYNHIKTLSFGMTCLFFVFFVLMTSLEYGLEFATYYFVFLSLLTSIIFFPVLHINFLNIYRRAFQKKIVPPQKTVEVLEALEAGYLYFSIGRFIFSMMAFAFFMAWVDSTEISVFARTLPSPHDLNDTVQLLYLFMIFAGACAAGADISAGHSQIKENGQ